MQFLGGTNLLTGHTDGHWKAVRKAVAPSFSAGNMRCAYFGIALVAMLCRLRLYLSCNTAIN